MNIRTNHEAKSKHKAKSKHEAKSDRKEICDFVQDTDLSEFIEEVFLLHQINSGIQYNLIIEDYCGIKVVLDGGMGGSISIIFSNFEDYCYSFDSTHRGNEKPKTVEGKFCLD